MEYLSYDSLYYQIYNVQPYWKEYCRYITDVQRYTEYYDSVYCCSKLCRYIINCINREIIYSSNGLYMIIDKYSIDVKYIIIMKNTAINYYGKSYVINGRNTITILTNYNNNQTIFENISKDGYNIINEIDS